MFFRFKFPTYADIRWTDEAEFIAEDPKLKNLVEIYLKNKERKLRNIVFDANTTEGGEIKTNSFQNVFFRAESAVQAASCDGWHWKRNVRPD